MNVPVITLTYRNRLFKIHYSHNVPANERPKITCSRDAEQILRPNYLDLMEWRDAFSILLLNRNNRVIGIAYISEGGVSGTVVDPKLVFQFALLTNATAMVLCHNHPSGNLTPSSQDTEITHKLRSAGKMMDIQVIDHVILTEDDYYSFADNNLF